VLQVKMANDQDVSSIFQKKFIDLEESNK
jgi:hypothetical protein